jgi:hypothetical protein
MGEATVQMALTWHLFVQKSIACLNSFEMCYDGSIVVLSQAQPGQPSLAVPCAGTAAVAVS